MKRIGERGEHKWAPVSWEEALDIVAQKLTEMKEKYGAETVCLFRGQGGDWGAPWHYALRFLNAFGSPNMSTPSHICYFPRFIAELKTYGGLITPNYDQANTIVEWGANRAETHLPAHGKINKALQREARLIVVDPVRTKLAARADVWLQPRPGTDGALALSMLHVIIGEELYDRDFVQNQTVGFAELGDLAQDYPPERAEEITWVPAGIIRRAARLYATNRPSCLYIGNGVEQHTNAFQTIRALCILRAVTGDLDVAGGNVFEAPLPMVSLKGGERLSPEQRRKRLGQYDIFHDITGIVPFPVITDAILSKQPYPIKAMLVIGGNPVASMPHEQRIREACKKLDFLAVADIFMTRTAELADIVLPAASHFEKAGFIASSMYGEYGDYVLLKRKVVDLDGCWPDWKIYTELAHRLGFADAFPWQDVEEAIDGQLKPSDITVEQLKTHPEGIRFKEGESYRKYKSEGFRTPSGKVEIYSRFLEERGHHPLPVYVEPAESPLSQPDLAKKYPLIGNSEGKRVWSVGSQLRNIPSLRRYEPEPLLKIHPRDAEPRGITDGDWVRITSPRAGIKMRAHVTEITVPGVVILPTGWGQAIPEANTNTLVDDQARDPISGGTGYRSFLCQVERERDAT
jgi:anaerobic selenocysteine-containing dehydrogenase